MLHVFLNNFLSNDHFRNFTPFQKAGNIIRNDNSEGPQALEGLQETMKIPSKVSWYLD
jgi:hypothetical protein